MAPLFVCHGCGAVVDATRALPFRCPNAGRGDVDHVLVAPETDGAIDGTEVHPFLRYRSLLSPYRAARAAGLTDVAWQEIVGELDESLAEIDKGFAVTPMGFVPKLAEAVGLTGRLLVKDETGNVAGSHKARHLFGVMLYLRAIGAAGLPIAAGLERRRLAIASCGNAALAAAVIARAADWPLDVFIPPDASSAVVLRLKDLGAATHLCERQTGEAGDPCYLRFCEAVAAGAIPFGVQGSDNGLAIEGGRTLAFEMAEGFESLGVVPGRLYVQVGGGALASGLAQGLGIARTLGWMTRLPRLVAVQTEGCAPLARAWTRLAGGDLAAAAQARSRFMEPWERTPQSLASGILDDETYDWWEIAKGLQESRGEAVVAPEGAVVQAWRLAEALTTIPVSATGAAGLAGLIAQGSVKGDVALVFSGVER